MQRKQNQKSQVTKIEKKDFKKQATVIVCGLLVLLAAVFTANRIKQTVKKEEMNVYICQIIDADPDSRMMAIQCLVKE